MNKYKIEKINYDFGTRCTIHRWRKNRISCNCDFLPEDINDIIRCCHKIRKMKATEYVGSKEYLQSKKFDEEWKKRNNKWYIRLHNAIKDITIQIRIFEWRLAISSRKFNIFNFGIDAENIGRHTYTMLDGIHVGPFVVTI